MASVGERMGMSVQDYQVAVMMKIKEGETYRFWREDTDNIQEHQGKARKKIKKKMKVVKFYNNYVLLCDRKGVHECFKYKDMYDILADDGRSVND